MGSWNEIRQEIIDSRRTDGHDYIRRKYLEAFSKKTGRNVIAYYSGWLQKPNIKGIDIDDGDKSAFMNAIYKMDRTKGLDLILHTPGGQVAATESIVDYLRKMFGVNIIAYIPQIAMSAGTMIACACKEIIMGNHSNLGPIDPQFNGIPAFGVVEEFDKAMKDVKEDQSRALIWRAIIGHYHPTFIGECINSIKWSKEIVTKWLEEGMFAEDKSKASAIVGQLGSRDQTLTHARHLGVDECERIGLKIRRLEKNQDLQDALLSVHHAFILTFSGTSAIKITENQEGKAYVLQAQQIVARPL